LPRDRFGREIDSRISWWTHRTWQVRLLHVSRGLTFLVARAAYGGEIETVARPGGSVGSASSARQARAHPASDIVETWSVSLPPTARKMAMTTTASCCRGWRGSSGRGLGRVNAHVDTFNPSG
jgi:hypothetical protein